MALGGVAPRFCFLLSTFCFGFEVALASARPVFPRCVIFTHPRHVG
jgi:hypothetical protein